MSLDASETPLTESELSQVPRSTLAVSTRLGPSIAQTMLQQSSAWDWNRRDWKRVPYVALASILLHAVALGTLGFIVLKAPELVEVIFTTVTGPPEPVEPIIERSMLVNEEIQEAPPEELFTPDLAVSMPFETTGSIDLNVSDEPVQVEKSGGDSPGPVDITPGDITSGRLSSKTKKAMVQKFGGNAASEAAVAHGLRWLANHQMANGSWSFAHSAHPKCKGQCSQNGTLVKCPNGATSLALLAFLGGGHTQISGDYQKEVKRALDFLLKAGKSSTSGLDLRGNVVGNEGMYVQGLGALALCECAAMTRDARVRKAAQSSLEFIVNAQNQNDGGWRYVPGAPGDTSVLGWQVMALKSGYNAKLDFPNRAFKGAEKFLDLVQYNRGTEYGYLPDTGRRRSGAPSETMTAVALLCRMYLGWDRSNPKLVGGVRYLDSVKPMPDNMYFNYYATQVMHHWGGDEWTRWNDVMRDQLVKTQRTYRDGHLAGSWDLADPHGYAGGRLYMTCLSVMTLEIYYRYLPLYNNETLKVEF